MQIAGNIIRLLGLVGFLSEIFYLLIDVDLVDKCSTTNIILGIDGW